MRTSLGIFICLLIMGCLTLSCGKRPYTIHLPNQGAQADNQILIGSYAQNPNLSFYAGSGAPRVVGASGDYYLDLVSGNLYGPFTSLGWGAGSPLKQDTTLSHIYSAANLPPPVVGKTGDFYLDVWLFQLYGPKTDSAGWGNPIPLTN